MILSGDASRHARGAAWLLLGVFFAHAAAGQTNLPIEDVRIPVEVYEDGSVKTQVVAGRARIPAQGDIFATEVIIEFYAPDGQLESRVKADRCRYDRQKGVASSDGPVRYERKGVVISGVGFEWRAADESVRILNSAKVVFRRGKIAGLHGRFGRPGKDTE